MQLIIKDNTIYHVYNNDENVISNYPDCMSIFTETMQVYDIQENLKINIIPKKVVEYPELSFDEINNKIISSVKKIDVFSEIQHQSPGGRQKTFKQLSDLMIQSYISETYHTSTSQIKLDTVTNLHRPVAWIKEDLKKYVALLRWEVEIGGCIWNNWEVHTDRESQSKITASYIAAVNGLRVSPSLWKFKHGFESLTNAQMIEMSTTVLGHIQYLYTQESELKQIIDDCSDLGDIEAVKPIIQTYFI